MPGSRGHSPVTPAALAAWEAETFDPLRRLRDRARSTPVDDVLPENPQDHPVETRSALEQLDGA